VGATTVTSTLAGARARLRATARDWWDEPLHLVSLRARVLRPYRSARFASFGRSSVLHKPAWVYGPQQMSIGERCLILEGAWLAVERPAWSRPGPTLRLGDDVTFRSGATLSASVGITIEDAVVFGAMVSVVDSTHTWRAGGDSVLWNPVEEKPIRIGRGSWLADKVTVVAGADIGERCAIGANSVVIGSIPDGSVAVGSPARVVGRTEDL
jgi:acetyltransferase-like isoleucine patch superfamily enzyme